MRGVLTSIGEVGRVLRGDTATHEHYRQRLMAIVVVTLAIDAVCSVLVLLLERHVQGTQITGYPSALFFSTTQLLSVSSSFTNPLTGGGQLLDVAMEVYAITIVAALAGSTGAFLHRRSQERRGEVPEQ